MNTTAPLTVERHCTAGVVKVDAILVLAGSSGSAGSLWIHDSVNVIECKQVLRAEVNTEFLYIKFSGYVLRNRVSEGQVLDSQVGQIVEVLGLRRIVVDAGVPGKSRK